MGKGNRVKGLSSKRNSSLVRGMSNSKTASINSQNTEEDFLISFRYMDRNQGQTLDEWQEDGILARAIDKLRNYCCGPLKSHVGNGLVVYGNFPKESEFEQPDHVPEDAEWARIHITGTQVVAGYVNKNVFNVVFLDKNHGFYITKKKHT